MMYHVYDRDTSRYVGLFTEDEMHDYPTDRYVVLGTIQ